jgi:LDH2 family malate/lactate/ureidoglycolate dehydrogenase
VALVKSAEELDRLGREIFLATGATEENAEGVMRSLIGANLAGHDSHGVIRIPSYLADIKIGRLLPAATPELARETAATATIDGANTFGQVGARLAARTAAQKARQTGLGAASLFQAHHTGRVGEWAELGASEGLVTFVAGAGAHGPRMAAPFGGTQAALGTNPFSWGIPRAGGRPPVLLDFATTNAAQGKLMVARARREPLPPGWILDKNGQPSTDVEDFYAGGALLPYAGHKGYAMSVVVEMLAVGLSGGEVVSPASRGSCLFIACFDPEVFRPDGGFTDTVERISARMKAVPPAPGVSEILLPGEPEARARAERRQQGVPLPEATWEALVAAAGELGVRVA